MEPFPISLGEEGVDGDSFLEEEVAGLAIIVSFFHDILALIFCFEDDVGGQSHDGLTLIRVDLNHFYLAELPQHSTDVTVLHTLQEELQQNSSLFHLLTLLRSLPPHTHVLIWRKRVGSASKMSQAAG